MQEPETVDKYPNATKEEVLKIQQVVGRILYYAQAADLTAITLLSTIASEQAEAMNTTLMKTKQLLYYLATHPNSTMMFYASKMIMNIHSDASYLSSKGARSRVSGIVFMDSLPNDDKPILLDGAFYSLYAIQKFVASSAKEPELGALFLNMKAVKTCQLTLNKLGHPQPPTQIHCDNINTAGISNKTVNKYRSRSTEMKYFSACDQVKNWRFCCLLAPRSREIRILHQQAS